LSISISCHGCGQRISVPDDFPRRKVRCSACGVYCEVIGPAKKPGAAAPAQKQPAQSDSPPAEKQRAKSTFSPSSKQPAKVTAPPAKAEAIFEDSYRAISAPQPATPTAGPGDPLPKTPPELAQAKPADAEEDDGAMYRFVAPDTKPCPDCRKELPLAAAICIHCGFNLETGKRPVKVFEEVNKTWEAGWPLERRRNLCLIWLGITLAANLAGAASTGQWKSFLVPWFFFSVMLTFVLGTYDRLDFTRDERGRVRLTRTWRIFFFPREPETINLRDYEGVTTGPANNNMIDWVVCIMLLPSVFFAALWWIFVISKSNFHVSLTQNHGFPEMTLYKGANEGRVKEIATTLQEVAGLPYTV